MCLLFGWQAVLAQATQYQTAPYQPQLMKQRVDNSVFQTTDPAGPGSMINMPTSTNKTSDLGTENVGRASNLYSIIRTSQANQVAVQDEEDFIAFIHRQDVQKHGGTPTTTSNGLYRIDYSTDGGGSFTIDVGPLVPISAHVAVGARARYPQMAVYRPNGATGIDDYKIVFAGPTTGGNGWGNYVYGVVSNLSQVGEEPSSFDSPNIKYSFLSNGQNRQVLIPNDLCMGEPGEFWMTDVEYDIANERLLNEIILWKGTLVGPNQDSLALEEAQRFDLTGIVSDCDNEWRHTNHNLAFSPDGQYGYLVFNGDWVEDGTQEYVFEPIMYKTEDGGDTWTGPIHVDLKDYTPIIDNITTLFTDPDNPGVVVDTSTRLPGASIGDLTVDANGNPHYFVRIFNQAEIQNPLAECDSALNFIQAGAAKPMFDITSIDRGETFCPKLIGFNNTFQGSIAGTDVGFGNALQTGRTADGNEIFYSWIDDTASTEPSVMAPNLWTAGLRISDDALIEPTGWSQTDNNYPGAVFFPQFAPVVGSNMSGADYKLPVFFAELIGGDDLSTTQFVYADNVEHSESDFVVPTEDLAVSSIVSPTGANPICGNSTVDVEVELRNDGTSTLDTVDVRLLVTGPIQTELVEDELVINLAPGATTTYTFSGVDISANGTYVINAFTQFDALCENNQEQVTVVNVGGSTGDIFTATSLEGCGELLLDAGLVGIPTTFTWSGGTENDQTLLLTTANSTAGETVTVTVTPAGCAPITDQVDVTVFELPAIDQDDESVCADPGTDITLTAQNSAAPGNTYEWRFDGTVINGATSNTLDRDLVNTNSGDYTIEVTTTNNCVNTKDVRVLIWDVEADLPANNDEEVCGEGSIDASNSTTYEGTIYRWTVNGTYDPSLDGLSAIPLLQGENTYEVEIEDPLGCKAPVTSSYTVLKSDSIEAELIAPDLGLPPLDDGIYNFTIDTTTRFPDGEDPLTPIESITWEFTGLNSLCEGLLDYDPAGAEDLSGNIGNVVGSDNLAVAWTGQGSNVVRVRIVSGACELVIAPPVTVPADVAAVAAADPACTNARSELANSINLNVFPNPSQDVFNIVLNSDNQRAYAFEVYDINGRVIITKDAIVSGAYETSVDLSGEAAGVYLLKITSEEGISTTRLVKE